MKVGLVGCGSIGRVHAMAINRTEFAKLCAVVDIKPEEAKAYSQSYTDGQAAVYTTLEAMIAAEELDVVHICTPHMCHVPMAITALQKGIHVFMEKPPAISRAEFEQLTAAEAMSGGRLGICFQNRYNESTKKVSELIAGGTFGSLRGGRAFVTWDRNADYYTGSEWRGRLASEGGGVLMNQSIHTLDLLLKWMGRPVSVEASMQNHHLKGYIEVEDTMEAYLTFTEGDDPVRAAFYATNTYVSDEPVFVELSFTDGFIRLEGDHIWYRDRLRSKPEYWQAASQAGPGKAYWGSGHEACIDDFYRCLNQDIPYQNDLKSSANTFYTVMDIYESARAQKAK